MSQEHGRTDGRTDNRSIVTQDKNLQLRYARARIRDFAMSDARITGVIAGIIARSNRADPTVLAAEIVTVIRSNGWLPPTPQTPPPTWHQPRTAGAMPTAEYRAARAAITREGP
jgi:hypothetical protein